MAINFRPSRVTLETGVSPQIFGKMSPTKRFADYLSVYFWNFSGHGTNGSVTIYSILKNYCDNNYNNDILHMFYHKKITPLKKRFLYLNF